MAVVAGADSLEEAACTAAETAASVDSRSEVPMAASVVEIGVAVHVGNEGRSVSCGARRRMCPEHLCVGSACMTGTNEEMGFHVVDLGRAATAAAVT